MKLLSIFTMYPDSTMTQAQLIFAMFIFVAVCVTAGIIHEKVVIAKKNKAK
jgi:hypothetical protein